MWNEDRRRDGSGLQLADVDLHRRAAVLRRLRDAAAARTGDITGARALGIFGDSVTTDHICPAGSIKDDFARRQIPARDTASRKADFNSYGARRGNHEVMMRGTFANVRIKNLMIPPQRRRHARRRRRHAVPAGAASRCRSTTPR